MTNKLKDNIWLVIGGFIAISTVFGLGVGSLWYLSQHCTAIDLTEKPSSYTFSIDSESRIEYRAAKPNAPRDSIPVAEGTKEKAQGRAAATDETSKPKYSWWDRFSCEVNASDYAIAFFTLILAIVTGFLWWTTYLLWKSGEKQLATVTAGITRHTGFHFHWNRRLELWSRPSPNNDPYQEED